MPASRDYKRRLDGDRGPNTGGMGAFSPVELYKACKSEIERQVLAPLHCDAPCSRGVLIIKAYFTQIS
jgi:phosphoribosylamine--glycine ligase